MPQKLSSGENRFRFSWKSHTHRFFKRYLRHLCSDLESNFTVEFREFFYVEKDE